MQTRLTPLYLCWDPAPLTLTLIPSTIQDPGTCLGPGQRMLSLFQLQLGPPLLPLSLAHLTRSSPAT